MVLVQSESMHVFHTLVSFFFFAKEKPVFPVLIPLRHRITLCFYALSDGIVWWMKPRSTSLLLGTITDLAKGKSELLVENALLRQHSSSCIGKSNDRPARRQIGSACYFSLVWLGPGNRRSLSSSRRRFCEGRVNSSVCFGSTHRKHARASRGSRTRPSR